MNIKLASALAFVGGFGVGALAVWRAAGSHFREKAEDEIEEMRIYYVTQLESTSERLNEEIERIQAERAAEVFHADPANEVVYGPSGPSYKDDPEILATTSEAARALLEYQGNDEASETFTILLTQREFEEGPPDDYDQETLTYYALDGILATPSDKQLDVKKAIGDVDPAWFGEKSDYPDVCYVRNTRMKIDFEVVRSLESYAKTVLGLGDDSG